MRKTFAVFKREYLQAVKKKAFIFVTLLFPVMFAGMMFIPSLMIKKGMGAKRIAIIDGTGKLEGMTRPEPEEVDVSLPGVPKEQLERARRQSEGNFVYEYVDASRESDLRSFAQPWIDRFDAEESSKVHGVLSIPQDVIRNASAKIVYYSRSATDMQARNQLGRSANREIQKRRLSEEGLAPEALDAILARVSLDAVQVTKSGKEAQGGEMDFLVGFLFAALLLVPALMYGIEIMRGVVQEKTDRVVEILVSSMKPIELLSGKILGLAAVGLTQLSVWVGMAAIAGAWGGAMLMMSGDVNVAQFLRVKVFVYFILFYLLAYMLYVCVYAAAGAVSNNEKEAQQFLTPIVLILMIPWFLMMPIIMNPDSNLSVFLSLFPLFAPITMFVRTLVSEPPLWQVAAAVALSIATIWGMFWMTAKIFRVGILAYGKPPNIPELWRWLKQA